MSIRILCWNVNGLRAVLNKGFLDWMNSEKPDILCLQETKVHLEQLPAQLQSIPGYEAFFESGTRKGYSGVAVYTRLKPLEIRTGFGTPEFDVEGRIQLLNFGDFWLYNIYYPNGKASPERLDYKMRFYQAFLKHADGLKKKGAGIIACGDFNTAHKEIDLARPKENEKVSGFLPEERAWIDKFISHGYVDTFRLFESGGGNYTWWDYKTRARERDIGWRIDYFFTSDNIKNRVKSAFILKDVPGSDHCPVGIELEDS